MMMQPHPHDYLPHTPPRDVGEVFLPSSLPAPPPPHHQLVQWNKALNFETCLYMGKIFCAFATCLVTGIGIYEVGNVALGRKRWHHCPEIRFPHGRILDGYLGDEAQAVCDTGYMLASPLDPGIVCRELKVNCIEVEHGSLYMDEVARCNERYVFCSYEDWAAKMQKRRGVNNLTDLVLGAEHAIESVRCIPDPAFEQLYDRQLPRQRKRGGSPWPASSVFGILMFLVVVPLYVISAAGVARARSCTVAVNDGHHLVPDTPMSSDDDL
eukprot:gnl/TRDRNA2_/TRDRNA2_170290_c0_seq4.p1 gnl/TRDRNA2_/TRDRNA2_170290_c0~~gnl/TRDRNA2_/TRDRNA2_170290_c0_seq4.p1  ORF type:complete len:268 (+),score=39.51 gnl/TRDRNA2_/TRDRNA2_170290_c0_seq4:105-908(+)